MPRVSKELLKELLCRKSGREYWRGLSELAEAPELVGEEGEFPEGASEPPLGVSRRGFIQLMGASAALAGAGCSPPTEKILPYNLQPPEITPGVPLAYATSMVIDGYATGLLVRSNDGRPTKVDGNPEHPASLGATSPYAEASVLSVYDPARARGVSYQGAPRSWESFVAAMGAGLAQRTRLRFLLEPTSSPLLLSQIERIKARYPEARFTFYTPLPRHSSFESSRQLFGQPLEMQYDFSSAKVVLALDADFLSGMPFSLRWARDFAERRRLSSPEDEMNRLYVAEAMYSPTGTLADHRLRCRPSEIKALAAAVLMRLMELGFRPRGMPQEIRASLARLAGAARNPEWVEAVARDLGRAPGAGVVIVGDRQPPLVHIIAHLIHRALGNWGKTVWATESPLYAAGSEEHPLEALAEEMARGEVDTLVILGQNLSYSAPADLEISRFLRTVPESVYLGLYRNETARDCKWFLPEAHYLESWGDARAYDGTVSFIQPLIEPLFGGRTASEVLTVFLGEPFSGPRTLLRSFWQEQRAGGDFETFWQQSLQRGFLPDSAAQRVEAEARWEATAPLFTREDAQTEGLEVNFIQDHSVYDGRFAQNGWLQELPRPLTKLTWDNAAILSPRTALRLGVEDEELLRLTLKGRELVMPALILPGHADDVVTLPLGYGHEGEESLARGVGFNTYRLRTTDLLYFGGGLRIEKAGGHYPLALTQTHWRMQGRPIAPQATLAEYRAHPDFTEGLRGPVPSLLPEDRYVGEQWAMTIDTMVCVGCNACVVACQAENNIPIVGKEEVRRSREMHWLRIDHYFIGDVEEPAVVNQPMLCQHCEKAPCEYVCPVNATVHSPDGLNEMIYNRCVGTRFCSNNCPYKVRRFNWFDYTRPSRLNLVHNPEVTVRDRGVMEKCTYCVQRIRIAEIRARIAERPIQANEVTTACQEACPTRAIQFGSLYHPETDMVKWRTQPRSYAVLHSLGTKPRNIYLAKITNPNEALAGEESLKPSLAPTESQEQEP